MLESDAEPEEKEERFDQLNLRLSAAVLSILLDFAENVSAEAYEAGVATVEGAILSDAGKEAVQAFHTNKVRTTGRTVRSYKETIAQTAIRAKKQYDIDIADIQTKIQRNLATGDSVKDILKQVTADFKAQSKIVEEGNKYMFTITDKNGVIRRVKPETYANVIVDSVGRFSRLDGEVEAHASVGQDILRVPTNGGTSDECVNFEGALYSISGENKGKSVKTSRGTETVRYSYAELRNRDVHLWHINCRHTFGLFVEYEII